MTRSVYYEDPYAQEGRATVVAVDPKGTMTWVEVNQTIFYPDGGGQPSDQGFIKGMTGQLKVEFVQYKDGRVLHQGKLQGLMSPGDSVSLVVKWNMRHHNMRVHSAGHLVHDVLMSLAPDLVPQRGSHGKKAFLQYSGSVGSDLKDALEQKVNDLVEADLPIEMRESSYDEIVATCKFVPAGLPKNKPLRTLRIGTFSTMPDGGVHVRSTREIGHVVIQELTSDAGVSMVKYRVTGSHGEDSHE
jgi:alanyl-tRNA synthetase